MFQKSKYLYITGRLRVKETRMFNNVDLERMIDAPDAKEAFRVLNNTDFFDNLLELPEGKLENFQKVLDEELHDVRKFLKQNVPDEHVIRYLALKYNFSNLKILLKEKLCEEVKHEAGSSLASVSREFLEECINYKTPKQKRKRKKVALRDLKLVYHLAVKEVLDYYENNSEDKNPVMIDLILDKHYYAELLRWSKFFGSKFIKNYIIAQIDLHNILTFLRLKRDGRDMNILKLAILEGGSIKKEVFLTSIKKSLDHFKKELDKTIYSLDLKNGWDFYIQNNEFWMLERDIDNILVRMLNKTKHITYGPEVAFAYLWGKHNVVRNIRIIMLAKMNNIEPKLIKERVREIY
jgi:V/A-type H+-transporting ATPase subunit C